jgi:glycosyltransferase involved in cell wall biosynthesis
MPETKPVTILHTEASMGWGGQEIRLVQEASAFKERGCKVFIACRSGSRVSQEARARDLKVFEISMRSSFDPAAVLKVFRIIKAEKVDIVHTHSSRDSWIAGFSARLAGVPVVRSRHLSTPVGPSWFTTFVYRHLSDEIITSGENVKKTLVTDNRLDPEKITSVAMGVDVGRFDPAISGEGVRRELGLDGFYPIVGIVAVLRSWKGHTYFLEAVKDVVSSCPKARFLIVGGGPGRYVEILRSLSRDLGIEKYVIMTGHREDIPEVLAALDILVLTSYACEAAPQIIPQALAMGKPVIGTNVGGIPELIEDGRTGMLITPKNPKAISDAIIRYADNYDRASEMAQRGRENILKDFTFHITIDKTEDVYNRAFSRYQQ